MSVQHDVSEYGTSSVAEFASNYNDGVLPDEATQTISEANINNDAFETTYEIYSDKQLWLIEHFPSSALSQVYLNDAKEISDIGYEADENGIINLASNSDINLLAGSGGSGKSVDRWSYIYANSSSAYQWLAIDGGPISDDVVVNPDQPGDLPQPQFYAEWSPAPQSASDEFTFTYSVNPDKNGTVTNEKIDNAKIDIEPLKKSGEIDGGNWTISPATKQTVSTSGHTNDNNYQNNGGTGKATWTLKYSVTKTVSGTGGKVGPYASQVEADAAAAEAKANAEADLLNQAKIKSLMQSQVQKSACNYRLLL